MTNIIKALSQVDIFNQISAGEIGLIAELCRERVFETGALIFLEGDHSRELYIILEGEVDILVNPALVGAKPEPDQKPVTIATLRRGQCFGEIALVDAGRRSATARAAHAQTRLLVIGRQDLMSVCQENPGLGFRLMYNLAVDLALKLRSTDLRILEYLLPPNTG